MTNKSTTISTGKIVELKEYVTYGQHRKLVEFYANNLKKDGDVNSKTEGDIMAAADKLGAEMVLVSIDGQTENLYEMILELPVLEGKEIMELVAEVLDPKKELGKS